MVTTTAWANASPALVSTIDPASEACRTNEAAHRELAAQLREKLAAARLGGAPAQERALRAQGRKTIRKLLDAGILTGGGSDGPVVPYDPFLSMWWMTTRTRGFDERAKPSCGACSTAP